MVSLRSQQDCFAEFTMVEMTCVFQSKTMCPGFIMQRARENLQLLKIVRDPRFVPAVRLWVEVLLEAPEADPGDAEDGAAGAVGGAARGVPRGGVVVSRDVPRHQPACAAGRTNCAVITVNGDAMEKHNDKKAYFSQHLFRCQKWPRW